MELEEMNTAIPSPTSNWVVALGCAAVFLFTIYLHTNFKHNHDRHRQPPGPRALPLIGHFHLLTDKTKPIHQILSSLSTLYGPIMQLRLGSRPVLVISSSQLAKECYSTNDLAFASRPQLAQGKHMGYDFYMLSWAPYALYWRNVRKICVVELLSSKRIQSFQPKRTREISIAMNSLFQQGLSHHKIINMNEVLFHLIFNVLMSMIIDEQYLGEKSEISFADVKHAMEKSLVLHGAFCIGIIVEKHRENKWNKKEDEMDFIDVLISEEKNEAIADKDVFVKVTAMLMLVAGSETSSVALEWALSLLLVNPHTLKKAQDELDSKVGRKRVVKESDIGQLKYLQAIVKETLRLHPPVPLLVPHQSIEACTVEGFHIPAGTTLKINAWAIQREAKVWNKPLEFIPERFMEGEGEIEIENIYNRGNEFEMIPFGAGRRGCPGVSLAMTTMHIILARLLQGFDWNVPDGEGIDMSEGVGITMPRAVPLKVVVSPRLPHSLYY